MLSQHKPRRKYITNVTLREARWRRPRFSYFFWDQHAALGADRPILRHLTRQDSVTTSSLPGPHGLQPPWTRPFAVMVPSRSLFMWGFSVRAKLHPSKLFELLPNELPPFIKVVPPLSRRPCHLRQLRDGGNNGPKSKARGPCFFRPKMTGMIDNDLMCLTNTILGCHRVPKSH